MTSTVAARYDLKTRDGRINTLIEATDSQSYLEIGVHKGKTFRRIKAKMRIAVDPLFMFDIEEFRNDDTLFYACTSDEFFAKHATQFAPFDFIYLDGLHTFEQTFRDLICSVSLCHRKSLILIDDTIPINIASAEPDLKNTHALRRICSIESNHWMGDIFKVVAAVHDFLPLWDYATFPDHGQTVLAFGPRQEFVPLFNDLSKISAMSYAEFLIVKDRGIYKVAESPEKIIDWVRDLAAASKAA